MFGLLKKHCPVCGMDVEKDTSVKRFGKHFCSMEHAEKFGETNASHQQDNSREFGGGCC